MNRAQNSVDKRIPENYGNLPSMDGTEILMKHYPMKASRATRFKYQK